MPGTAWVGFFMGPVIPELRAVMGMGQGGEQGDTVLPQGTSITVKPQKVQGEYVW